ncbi:hypothetical protein [Paraburkholderia sp. J12]|uniref:hypothetical protein n=1 Tax=Paraburkholderia sp. J12 TaxID=2805432 RepID=UPI002ABE9D67|nr:hypothetical protein [Paraburkholderia sp. J12]
MSNTLNRLVAWSARAGVLGAVLLGVPVAHAQGTGGTGSVPASMFFNEASLATTAAPNVSGDLKTGTDFLPALAPAPAGTEPPTRVVPFFEGSYGHHPAVGLNFLFDLG